MNSNQLALTLEPDTEWRQDLPPADRELIERAIRCLEERYRVNLDVLTSPGATRDYVKLRLDGLGYEVFAMILLDNRHGVMRYVESFRGTLDGASVHPREVVRLVMAHNAAAVILAHNHPSGVTEPSQADIRITLTLRASGMAIGGPAPLAPTAPPGQTVAAGQGQRHQPSLNPT